MRDICSKCYLNPNSHSFKKVYQTSTVDIFYTNPSEALLYKDTEGILLHYRNYLNSIRGKKWIWIFNSEDFGLSQALEIKTAIGISKIISNNSNSLNKIFIINPTGYIKNILKIVSPFLSKDIKNKIEILNDKLYELKDVIEYCI
jgi:hypothetical protein